MHQVTMLGLQLSSVPLTALETDGQAEEHLLKPAVDEFRKQELRLPS